LKLSQIMVQICDTWRFRAPFGGLEATYTVHLRLIGKPVIDFLFVFIELFSLDVTAEALRANIDWISAFLNGLISFGQIFT